MGGSMPSQTQGNNSQLAQMFGQNQPVQQNQIAPIQAPGVGPMQARPPLMPSQQQAAAATQARMLARTPPPPMAAPAAAPQRAPSYTNRGGNGGNR